MIFFGKPLHTFPDHARQEVMMLAAQSEVQVDTPEVRVTQWRLAPGSATGTG